MPESKRTSSVLEYFTGLASIYAEHRPSYPRPAIEAILDGLPQPAIVADIGCGTGISSRLFAAAGARVIGIDPNEEMLNQAHREAASGVQEFRKGTGEHTGLDDAGVDVVVCAQSFHWFDDRKALKEFHRILRPASSGGGRLALVWNVRDDADAFTAGYGRAALRAQENAIRQGRIVCQEHHGDPTVGGWFEHPRTLVFPNAQRLDLNGLLGRLRSASYFPAPDDPLRAELENDLRKLFDHYQRDGSVTLMYRTEVTLAQRVEWPPAA